MPAAIITGATQGMGKAIAEVFLSNGFSVAICARSHNDLHAVEAEWKAKFPSAEILAYSADLTVKQDVLSFARHALERFPAIDVLVNNAGTYYPGTLAGEPEGNLEKLMNLNFFSSYHLTRQVLPAMRKKKGGHIFNMSSIAGLRAYANGGAYGITKYAMRGFSDNLRLELMPEGIKVTAVFPGATYTRSWHDSGVDPGRMMEASDIAKMVWAAYSLSPGANVDNIEIRPLKGDI
jgi:short-subunit dehydrogenase